MTTGTKIRTLARLLDAAGAPLFAIGPTGHLVYLSAAVADWLGVDVETLLARRCIAGAAVSDDPLDRLAAAISPPQALASRGTASLRVQPPPIGNHRPDAIDVRFIRVGSGDSALTLAVGGTFDDRVSDPGLQDAVAIRQRLDAWRRRHATITTIATAGTSFSARRLRRRLQAAGAIRIDVGFYGPAGCGSESIAARIHALSSPGESIAVVDGPLMDAELLDATLMPVVNIITDSSDARGTALVRGLDEMPMEAQLRLAELHSTYAGRLRLIALCGSRPGLLSGEGEAEIDPLGLEEPSRRGLCKSLVDVLSTLSVTIEPLASRVEDIPLMATAILDWRHAAGEGPAERLSRVAIDSLVIYPWPGNFDELDAAIRHAVRTATGTSIAAEHLPLAVRSYRPGQRLPSPKTAATLDDAVQQYELRLISEAVEAAGGNRAEAARRLGISRARLLRKINDANEAPPSKSKHRGK